MKKLISIVLTLALLCSISLVGTDAAKLNVAPTKTPQWFFSTEPYADITTINGYVYGYIGDSDDDGNISVLDATAVQLHVALLDSLSEDGIELADVDFDSELSVMDATEIQLFIAQLSNNEYISHTLYTDDLIEYTFDQIVYYLTEYGDYDAAKGYYCSYYVPTDVEDVECALLLVYTPGSDCIDLFMQYYQVSTDTWVDTLIKAYRGNPVFSFGSKIYDDNYTYCQAFGTSEINNLDDMSFLTECIKFESDYYSSFNDVSNVFETQFNFTIATADELLWEHIDYYVSDLFW